MDGAACVQLCSDPPLFKYKLTALTFRICLVTRDLMWLNVTYCVCSERVVFYYYAARIRFAKINSAARRTVQCYTERHSLQLIYEGRLISNARSEISRKRDHVFKQTKVGSKVQYFSYKLTYS